MSLSHLIIHFYVPENFKVQLFFQHLGSKCTWSVESGVWPKQRQPLLEEHWTHCTNSNLSFMKNTQDVFFRYWILVIVLIKCFNIKNQFQELHRINKYKFVLLGYDLGWLQSDGREKGFHGSCSNNVGRFRFI